MTAEVVRLSAYLSNWTNCDFGADRPADIAALVAEYVKEPTP